MVQSNIDKQIHRIRELINKPLLLNNIAKRKSKHYKIYSCLDVIGDTELAIDAYYSNKSIREFGLLYLIIYGILQILYVQQDAVFNLCKALGMEKKVTDYPELIQIRDIRHLGVGHPTEKSIPSDKPTSYNFITRVTMTHNTFELSSILKNGKQNSKDVEIPKIIKKQQGIMSKILKEIIDKLEKDEMNFKKRFIMNRLISCFPTNLDYFLSNILLGTMEINYQTRGKASLPEIRQAIENYRDKLTRRNINIGECHLDFKETMYSLKQLEEFFQAIISCENPNINNETAYIFAFFLKEKVKEMINISRDVDKEYQI